MSLFRGLFPEQREKLNTEASFRVRGLRGFDPAQLPAVQDPFYAQDPIFWQLGGSIGAAVGNTGKVGVQTPADPTLRCIVDGVIVSAPAIQVAAVTVVVGGAALLVLTTDTSVFTRNRVPQEQSGSPSGNGLLRINDNGAIVGTSGQLGFLDLPASTATFIPLGYTLFGSEQLFVAGITVNVPLRCVMWGRLSRGGR